MVECVRSEMYKLFIKNKGLLLLAVFILIKIIMITQGSNIAIYEETSHTQQMLNSYYEQWSGKITEKNRKEIEEKKTRN